MTKLVMGEIICIGADDKEAIPYDEAVIHIDGDEDSEIRVTCPGALRLAPKIVAGHNNHDALVKALALQEAAEEAHANCDECGGEEVPELCPKCFPLFDDARIARRGILASVGGSPKPSEGA